MFLCSSPARVEVTGNDLVVAADDNADLPNVVAPLPLTPDTSEHGGDGRSSCIRIGKSSIALNSVSESEAMTTI